MTGALWAAAVILSLALLFARSMYPELFALTVVIGIPLLGVLGALVSQNQKALRSRSAAYGLNSAVTVILVIGIVGVLNFMVSRYPLKLDTTKNKLHTFSDQTVKIMKSLQTPVKALFFANLQQKEQFRPLLRKLSVRLTQSGNWNTSIPCVNPPALSKWA